MFTALFTFLGGSAFRMIWGEISSYLSRKQDQQYEIERMKVQGELDAAQHARNLEALRVQADLKIESIRVQGEADALKGELEAYARGQEQGGKLTGIWFVDFWNGIIRPQFAQIALLLWVFKVYEQKFVMDEWDMSLAAGILGWFVADRSLGKKGK